MLLTDFNTCVCNRKWFPVISYQRGKQFEWHVFENAGHYQFLFHFILKQDVNLKSLFFK